MKSIQWFKSEFSATFQNHRNFPRRFLRYELELRSTQMYYDKETDLELIGSWIEFEGPVAAVSVKFSNLHFSTFLAIFRQCDLYQNRSLQIIDHNNVLILTYIAIYVAKIVERS